MSSLRKYVLFVNSLNEKVGRVASFLVVFMIGFLVYEVFMRYLFDSPTVWAHELGAMLYGVYFLLGGGYTLKWDEHIRVDIIYNSLSIRTKAILDLITWLFFYAFCAVLVIEGTQYAWISVKGMERSNSMWEPFIWPSKICIPLGGLLILLQGLAKTLRDAVIALTGRDLLAQEDTRSPNA
jgi:TRAP-type mannitol/chloroaromatic compound transport system permease small subunit